MSNVHREAKPQGNRVLVRQDLLFWLPNQETVGDGSGPCLPSRSPEFRLKASCKNNVETLYRFIKSMSLDQAILELSHLNGGMGKVRDGAQEFLVGRV